MDDHHRRFTVCSLFVVANLLVLLNMFEDRGGIRVSGDPKCSSEGSPLNRQVVTLRRTVQPRTAAGQFAMDVDDNFPIIRSKHSNHTNQIHGQLSPSASDTCPHRFTGMGACGRRSLTLDHGLVYRPRLPIYESPHIGERQCCSSIVQWVDTAASTTAINASTLTPSTAI